MILTNENNIDTTFTKVDIIESFDGLFNRFPTLTETGMPGLKIYGDNTDRSKAKNIKLFNDAQRWRNNYISNNGLGDPGQNIGINVDAVLIDNIIMDKYDGDYDFHNRIIWFIDIYYDHIWLFITDRIFMSVYSDGSIVFNKYNIFPSPGETRMPALEIGTNNMYDKGQNIELYNNAQKWRLDHNILHYGLSGAGRQPIRMYIDELIIDGSIIDEYDKSYNYYIDIYGGHIDLENTGDHDKFLTISKDGSVDVHIMPTPTLPIFNKFPTPTDTFMPGIKIYTNDTLDFKSKNIKLYNDAIQWRKDYISYNGLGDTGQAIFMNADALMIDDETIDKYDGKYNYYIGIHDDSIILLKNYDLEILTISSDGSVQFLFNNKFPTNTSTNIPSIKIYADNTDQSKSNNIELYNNAQEWRKKYILHNGLSDTNQGIEMFVDTLMIDDEIIDKYNGYCHHQIYIYNDHIILTIGSLEILTMSNDGYVTIINPI